MHAVIFDLDGTLANSALLTMEAFRRVAPTVGMPIPTMEQIRNAIGYANPEFYDRIYPGHATHLVRQLGDLVEDQELDLLPTMESDLLFDGCIPLLDDLAERRIPLYIASTGSREHVYALLDHAGITGRFEAIHCGQPDKIQMLRRIRQQAGDRSLLMVGDMNKDSDSARALGIPSIGAVFGYCVPERTHFDHYIHHPAELLTFVSTSD